MWTVVGRRTDLGGDGDGADSAGSLLGALLGALFRYCGWHCSCDHAWLPDHPVRCF